MHIAKRLQSVEKREGIDFATAEAMAFGSLLLDGYNVRLCGQDSGRVSHLASTALLSPRLNLARGRELSRNDTPSLPTKTRNRPRCRFKLSRRTHPRARRKSTRLAHSKLSTRPFQSTPSSASNKESPGSRRRFSRFGKLSSVMCVPARICSKRT